MNNKQLIATPFLAMALLLTQGCAQQTPKAPEKPKNIILLIGDGMGLAQVTAAMLEADKPLNLERAPVNGLVKTQSYDSRITDSGAGGTALATGHSTRNGMIGMSHDSTAQPSLIEVFSGQGKATGIVVSCAVTHATPASFIAKNSNRNNYEAIAAGFLHSPVDVVIGGGLAHFDKRDDGQKLTDSLKKKGYQMAYDLLSIKPTDDRFYLLTDSLHPDAAKDGRNDRLVQETELALETLVRNDKGFFLMIEGSQIDWAGHNNDMPYLLSEIADFDRVVGLVMDFADQHPGTLVVITADHETGGLVLAGSDAYEAVLTQVDYQFTTSHHSAVMVPLFAYGCRAEGFGGMYKNTDVFSKILEAAGVRAGKTQP
ncbi:MAG: alkaline phosphatase [Bacteroidales bacterium]|nr:alkaline phosphatase [Bacteroidales bacterium]